VFLFLNRATSHLSVCANLKSFLIISFPKYFNFFYMTTCIIILRVLNPCQHGFSKSESTFTNLVTYLDFATHLICSQRQADVVYFDLSNVLDLIPHALLLHKLTDCGISAGYVHSPLRHYSPYLSLVLLCIEIS
jgi:hypothetical protein